MVCGPCENATFTLNPPIQLAILIANEYVNQANVPLSLDIQAGTPYYYAVMLDSTSFSNASWTAYTSSNITVNLGSTQGWHTVWVGLCDMPGGVPTWNSVRLELLLTPPAITITAPGPGTNTVDQPVLQLQGYANEDLYSISYDLNNAAGLVTNQDVLVLNRGFDTGQWRLRTNTFQAFDIGLTPGNNTITLHAMDWAGNETDATYVYVLDYSSKTNPPVVQLYWPTEGAVISGDSFTWRGWVDDPTVTLSAQIVDSDGDTNVVDGIVERNGNFWVENLPLAPEMNLLTLTATDAVGNTNATEIAVFQSSVNLSITSIPDITCQKTITVSGTIDTGGYSVWVNGVLAGQSGTSWTANNVPVNGTGTAVIQALAISTSDNNGNGTTGTGDGGTNSSLTSPGNPTPSAAWAAPCCEAAPDKLPVIVYTQYHRKTSITNDANVLAWNGLASRQTYSEDWSLGVGGQTLGTGWSCENDGVVGGTDLTGLGFGWESNAWNAATGIGTITQGTSPTDWDYSQTDSSVTGSDWLQQRFHGERLFRVGGRLRRHGDGIRFGLVGFHARLRERGHQRPLHDGDGLRAQWQGGARAVPGGIYSDSHRGVPGTGWTPSTYGILGDLSWSSIPPTQITLAGGRLGSDGILYKTVSSGSPPIDIMPSFDPGPTPAALAAFWASRGGATQQIIWPRYYQFTVDATSLVGLEFKVVVGHPIVFGLAGSGRWSDPSWAGTGSPLVGSDWAYAKVGLDSSWSPPLFTGNYCNTVDWSDPVVGPVGDDALGDAGSILIVVGSHTGGTFRIGGTYKVTASGSGVGKNTGGIGYYAVANLKNGFNGSPLVSTIATTENPIVTQQQPFSVDITLNAGERKVVMNHDVVLQFPNRNGGASSYGSVEARFDGVTIKELP